MQAIDTGMREGVYLRVGYLAPRKRKVKAWGCTGNTVEEALNRAKEWLKSAGGRFVGEAHCCACNLWDVEFEGEVITMQSVPIFARWTLVGEV